MITGFMLWNEPNNLSHWDFQMDPEWKEFGEMIRIAAARMKSMRPDLPLILGGISPIDPDFIRLMDSYGALENIDAVGVHGFPLDWNHWKIDEWPRKLAEIERVTPLPVWVTEIGASSFGAEEVQVFGLVRTQQLLVGRMQNIFWYSLFDLPPTWGATTRHKEAEGSSYYRHFYLGLIRADGTPKPAVGYFEPTMDMCQWFHYEDHRLEAAVKWLRRLGVRRLRTGISWADWHRPNSHVWFDRQMQALEEFDTIITLCFTPPSQGKRPCHTSPPVDLSAFADFAAEVIQRYCPAPRADYVVNERRKDEMWIRSV